MLIVAFFARSMSAIVPEGPSIETTADESTIVMSPPPLPAVGLLFIAGCKRDSVWILTSREAPSALSANEEVFSFTSPRMSARKSVSIPALAREGTSTPTSMSIDTTAGARLNLRTYNAFGAGWCPARGLSRRGDFISQCLYGETEFQPVQNEHNSPLLHGILMRSG